MTMIPTGPMLQPPLTVETILKRFESLERRVNRLEINRTPMPLPMNKASDAAAMALSQPGMAPVKSPRALNPQGGVGIIGQGGYASQPVFGQETFNMQGTLQTGESGAHMFRYPVNLHSITAVLQTPGPGVTFQVILYPVGVTTGHGTILAVVNMDDGNPNLVLIGRDLATTDRITMNMTGAGTGAADLTVYLNLAAP